MVTCVLLVLAAGVGPLHAQDQSEVIIQLAVPGYLEEVFNSGVLDQFEAEHPGIRVELVTTGGSAMMINLGSSAGQGDIDDVLDEREAYVSSADVLAVSSADLSPEITRAGYYLDLKALINSDPELNSADFYAAVWQSFQWDDGFWALPAAADPILLFYDPAAFDAANLPYPDTWRSITDVELAIRTLTQLNADGTVASLGFMNMGNGPELLLLSLLGQAVYDDSVLPSVPRFNSLDLENLLTVWAQMQADGLFNPPQLNNSGEAAQIIDPPLQLVRSAFGGVGPREITPKKPALLPGGRAGLDVSGFAISSGTQYPEEAYELVKFLINNAQVASNFVGGTPANRNLTVTVPDSESGPRFGGEQSPELAALIPVALEQAYPTSETRFSEYLRQAIDHMVQDQVDANTALQDIEDAALTRLNTASERRDTTQIVVQTPLPTAELAPGEIALKFGISSFMSPLTNQDQWDAFAADFAARDPEVGAVQLKAGETKSVEDMATEYDCFFGSGNVVPTAELSLLRSMDPLLATDPTFDPNDMVGGVMQQVQRDGQTWGLPVTIQPFVMRFNPELFSQAGAVSPENGWTVEEFEYALQALKANTGDAAPFVPRSFGNTHLLMLIAAYGGLPLDYRTDPPTINFTDPNTVAAIQRVLDLAKNGYMDYSNLASLGGGTFSIMEDDATPLYTDTISSVGGFGGGGMMVVAAVSVSAGSDDGDSNQPPQAVDLIAAFPQGSTYTALSYEVSAAYISANTPYTEACYRFISELSRRADLITEMPARRSIINSPEIAAAYGPERVAFAQTMDALMQQPNTVIIPSGMKFDPAAMGDTLLTFWLNRAFDRYVNEDVDLATELADAEMFTKEFQNCIALIPAYVPSSDTFETYFQQFTDCALQVDPSTADYLGG
jgi:ABC-type glycerol-3-phosphate transport system substrate-binding protein